MDWLQSSDGYNLSIFQWLFTSLTTGKNYETNYSKLLVKLENSHWLEEN